MLGLTSKDHDSMRGVKWALLWTVIVQVEYHSHPHALVPRKTIPIMKALQDRGLRVFNVEPNYWC
jgi:hypothetical protein